jgi:predicted dehydrogenase
LDKSMTPSPSTKTTTFSPGTQEDQSTKVLDNISISRRRFLNQSALVSAFTLVPRHVLGGVGFTAPSDQVFLAVIGTGGQGIFNIKALLQERTARIIAIADPNEESDYSAFYYGGTAGRIPALKLIDETYKKQSRSASPKCSGYVDFRQMLEKEKSIDAVLVATPDHVHYVAAMAALQLGKHVYCEKPLCRTIYETRKLTETARQAKVATQMGNFGRSGEGIRLTSEWIRDGAIGRVREIHAWTSGEARPTIFLDRPKDTPPVPSGLDWDLWLGPVPSRPYHPAYHPFNWRDWWAFGSGSIGDMACHNLDPAFLALNLDYPSSTEASSYGCTQETASQASIVHFDFPARAGRPALKVHWYDGGIKPQRPETLEPGRKMGVNDDGIFFIGEKGTIMCGGWSGNPRLIPETAMRAYQRPAKTLSRSKGHHRDWLNACKGEGQTSASFELVGPMIEAIFMGQLAIRAGEKLYWDGPNLRCTNHSAANDLVRPVYRTGWSL